MIYIKRFIRLLLAVILATLIASQSFFSMGQTSGEPKTFILFDVSGSTADSRETLISLYKYLFTLFETSPYDIDLTICFFDENLWLDNENYVINSIVGENHKGTYASQLFTVLSSEKMFLNDTAVYDSLLTFNNNFISKLSVDEKKNTNVIVFSDMESTINTETNTHEAINRIFSQWIEEDITVKGLIWRETAKEFILQNGNNKNKIYDIDLSKNMGAYECLFNIYFDVVTGGYPDDYDFNPQQQSDVPVFVYPNAYRIYIITENSITDFKYFDSENTEYKNINGDVLFPINDFSDNPLNVFFIGKNEINSIGEFFIASNINDFKVYQIVAPQVTEVTISQNKQSKLIRAKEDETEFIIKYNPKIKLWEKNEIKLSARITISKDDNDCGEPFTIEKSTDNCEFKTSEKVFPENGEYDILVELLDEDQTVISEYKVSQYVAKANNSDSNNDIVSSLNVILIIIPILIILITIFVFVYFLRKKKRIKSWDL